MSLPSDMRKFRAPRHGWKIAAAIALFLLAFGYAGQDSYEQEQEKARLAYPIGCGQWIRQKTFYAEPWRTYYVCAEQRK